MNDVLHVKTSIYTSVDDIPVKMHCDSNHNPNPNNADWQTSLAFLSYLLTSTI
jgi:hypothetical protein